MTVLLNVGIKNTQVYRILLHLHISVRNAVFGSSFIRKYCNYSYSFQINFECDLGLRAEENSNIFSNEKSVKKQGEICIHTCFPITCILNYGCVSTGKLELSIIWHNDLFLAAQPTSLTHLIVASSWICVYSYMSCLSQQIEECG